MTALTRDTVLGVKTELKTRVEGVLTAAGVRADRWWFVPGRVEVFGKHTDYGGGPSLVGALPRGFLIAGRRRDDGVVRVADSGDQSVFELNLVPGETTPAEVFGWRRYVNILARRLQLDFPGAPIG